MSRFKFSTPLDRPFLKLCCKDIHLFQAWCSDLPLKQGNRVLVNRFLGWIRVKQNWMTTMYTGGRFILKQFGCSGKEVCSYCGSFL